MSLSAATYYVATNGSDSNPGTISQPWLTIQKGFSSIAAGDILYIRGGTYLPSGTISGGQISGAVANGKKGSASKMYNVFAYPGEQPVLDCRNITNTSNGRVGIYIVNSDYWYIKGIEITRVDQNKSPVQRGQGLLIQGGNYNKIELVSAHHNGGPGLELREACEGNVFLNCDAYSNYDPYSPTPGDDADGFDIGFVTARSGNDRVNTLIGCRSWLNSDDGFDMYQYPGYHGIYILKECWAWKNGYKTDGVTTAGDGNGFKYGADNNYSLDATVRRTSYNCVAYANRQRGFSQESANVKMIFYNNIAYQNGTWGFSFYYYDNADILRNNVSYKNPNGIIENQGSNRIHDHNSWDSKVTLSDADFVSLDASQLSLDRKSDGSLPDMTFLHLANGSDLIDAGVNVGIAYYGSMPDMGAFEVQAGAVDAVPVFINASVENATPSVVGMNYDLNLNNLTVPALSAFTVLVNSQARTISKVSVSGKNVLLTLSSPVSSGDVILMSYNAPSTNPLQTATGKEAASLSAKSVTNNVRAATPAYVSSVIQNASPAMLEITYDLTLANMVPAASSFKILVNSVSRTVTGVSISGTKVMLTLSSPVVYGNTVTVSYTKPSVNPLQTSTGGEASALSAQKVTNNVNPSNLVYVSSVIQNATPDKLVMTFNTNLSNILPAASAFKVLVNSSAKTVSSVAISGTTVTLTLSGIVAYGDVVTVSYTKPGVNPLQTTAGLQAATLNAQDVTNNVSPVVPVYVSSVIQNSTPSLIEITFDQTLANKVPAASAFKVRVNSSNRSVSSVAVSGSKVMLTMSSPAIFGNGVTVSYSKPSANPLQSTTGAQVSSMNSKRVTNNIVATSNTAPSVSITSPSNNSKYTTPVNISFAANANDADGSVILVEFYNGDTRLGSKSSSPYTFTWSNPSAGSYSITAVATDDKGAQTISSPVNISVASPTTTPLVKNKHPWVRISNPRKGNQFIDPADIEIEVVAADSDGLVTMVELFNGSEKLAEITSSPYIFTWKGVSAGTYQIYAVATDNLNDTTISSPVQFTVDAKATFDAKSEIINLYPNPSDGHFTVDFLVPLKNAKSQVIISDLNGNVVRRETITSEETTKEFELTNVRSGLYILTVIDNEIVVTKKIIIK